MSRRPDPDQADLFEAAAARYAVRRPTDRVRPIDLSLRIKTAMGEALKACPDSAAVVAARMSELLGHEITADALYACTAPSKPEHQISLIRFLAFVRVTQAHWLWDELLADDGLIVLADDEARHAQLGLLEEQQGRLTKQIRQLKAQLDAAPVRPRLRRRR